MGKVLRDLECTGCGDVNEEFAERSGKDGKEVIIKGPDGVDIVDPTCDRCGGPLKIVDVTRFAVRRATAGPRSSGDSFPDSDGRTGLLTERGSPVPESFFASDGDIRALKKGDVIAVGDVDGGTPRAAEVIVKDTCPHGGTLVGIRMMPKREDMN